MSFLERPLNRNLPLTRRQPLPFVPAPLFGLPDLRRCRCPLLRCREASLTDATVVNHGATRPAHGSVTVQTQPDGECPTPAYCRLIEARSSFLIGVAADPGIDYDRRPRLPVLGRTREPRVDSRGAMKVSGSKLLARGSTTLGASHKRTLADAGSSGPSPWTRCLSQ